MKRTGRYKNCETCGTEFYVQPSKVSKRWCSWACVPKERHSLGPQHQRQAATSICGHCGGEFYARPSEIGKGRKFCSRKCVVDSGVTRTAEASEKRRQANRDREGSKNPNFKHGKRSGNQIRGFTVRAKGEQYCRQCGSDGKLHLHHAIPRSMSRDARDKILNGIPLCSRCHIQWHRRSLTIYRDVFTADEWAYLTSVQLTGQRIEAWLDDHYPPRPLEAAA